MKLILTATIMLALIAGCAQPQPKPVVSAVKPAAIPVAAEPSDFVVSPSARVEPKPDAGK